MNLTTPQLTEIARRVMARRYLVKNEAGKPTETPQQRFERVARHVAQAEKNYGNDPEAVWPMLYELMAQRDFLPNTPCLANAGRDEGTGQLSACFVLPVPDSMDGIFEAVKQQALIHKSGGGTGMAFSRLRPLGDFVKTTTGVSSGPITFMEIFDAATEGVKQGGIRRGANMGILRVDHPDILSFIRCKADTSKITNFNISVAITDAFMAALEQNGDYALVNPKSKLVTGRLRAHDVWQAIVEQAHATGEPGLFFIDRTNDLDPLSETLGPIEATNPCGEVPLRGHDACTLGSINLSNFFVESPVGSVGDEHYTYGTIDFERLAETVKRAVRFLDNVLDVNDYPVEEIYRVTGQSRKIGLGVMGWADLLIKLGIPYASKRALDIGRQVMRYVNDMAVQASEALAEEREPFPAWAGSKWAQRGEKPRRNSTVTVIAPTGSISIIAGCSSGIEPVFALSMVRNQAEMKMVDVHPLLEEVGRREGWWSSDLAEKVAANGSVQSIEYIPGRWREVFKVAGEIDPAYHVAMQAAFQEHTEDAVSKCVAAGTLIPTDRGLIRIEDFSGNRTPKTFTEVGDIRTAEGQLITSHYCSGDRDVYRVRFSNGTEIVGSPVHKVQLISGWTVLSSISVGDLTVGRFSRSHGDGGAPIPGSDSFNRNANQIRLPEYMSTTLAEWLGMLVADGHLIESTGCVGLTHKNVEVGKCFTELTRLLFDVSPKETVDRRNGVEHLYLTSRNLVRRLTTLIGLGAYHKRAPDEILVGSADEKLAFLRGLTLDGYRKRNALVVYNGMSRDLAYHTAEISRSFGLPGVQAGRKWVEESNAFSYYVQISGQLQNAVVPVEPHKRGPAAEVDHLVYVPRDVIESTTVPVNHPHYGALRSLHQDTSRTWCYRRIAKVFDWPTTTPLVEVTSVDYDPTPYPLFDIEVAGTHDYTIGGVVSHNTINLPQSARAADIEEAYLQAWQLGCKGITVYRDGCRPNQTLTPGSGKAVEDVAREDRRHIPASGRRQGVTITKKTALGSIHTTLTTHPDDGEPFEVFIDMGKSGSELRAFIEALGRTASLLLKVAPEPRKALGELAEQLARISGGEVHRNGREVIVSAPDGIAHAIRDFLDLAENLDQTHTRGGGDLCPDCGGVTLYRSEGCMTCRGCGFSRC